jgi:hypothetical protein
MPPIRRSAGFRFATVCLVAGDRKAKNVPPIIRQPNAVDTGIFGDFSSPNLRDLIDHHILI